MQKTKQMGSSRVPVLQKNARNAVSFEPMLTLKEAAAVAGISIRQLYRMKACGRGPRVVLFDGAVRVSPEALREWVAHHTEPEPGRLPAAYWHSAA